MSNYSYYVTFAAKFGFSSSSSLEAMKESSDLAIIPERRV